MRDETSLRRLAEMGIDVYQPRAASAMALRVLADSAPMAPVPEHAQRGAQPAAKAVIEAAPAERIDVLLLARGTSPRATALLTDVARTLRFARVACARLDAPDESALATAAALVMFGDACARAAGAALPAQRQREIGWVVMGEPDALAGDAPAKRALWSELKRMLRGMAAGRGTLAATVSAADHHANGHSPNDGAATPAQA
ncbi:hypothetical protein [Dokdonella soli]|uniref:Uncharacterized protein n=1 Tax=Dokdonella soli TaxID=529810 RepID=A0ABN1IIL0_9GAMM